MTGAKAMANVYLFLEELAMRLPKSALFNFSTYKIVDYFDENDEREFHVFPGPEVALRGFLKQKAQDLLGKTKREMSVLSHITYADKPGLVQHIPMIDLQGADPYYLWNDNFNYWKGLINGPAKQLAMLKMVQSLTFFSTKSGMHAYGENLLSPEDNKNWLLELIWLKENCPKGSEFAKTIDQYWILKALQRGFGSLRISANTLRYAPFGGFERAGSIVYKRK